MNNVLKGNFYTCRGNYTHQ